MPLFSKVTRLQRQVYGNLAAEAVWGSPAGARWGWYPSVAWWGLPGVRGGGHLRASEQNNFRSTSSSFHSFMLAENNLLNQIN